MIEGAGSQEETKKMESEVAASVPEIDNIAYSVPVIDIIAVDDDIASVPEIGIAVNNDDIPSHKEDDNVAVDNGTASVAEIDIPRHEEDDSDEDGELEKSILRDVLSPGRTEANVAEANVAGSGPILAEVSEISEKDRPELKQTAESNSSNPIGRNNLNFDGVLIEDFLGDEMTNSLSALGLDLDSKDSLDSQEKKEGKLMVINKNVNSKRGGTKVTKVTKVKVVGVGSSSSSDLFGDEEEDDEEIYENFTGGDGGTLSKMRNVQNEALVAENMRLKALVKKQASIIQDCENTIKALENKMLMMVPPPSATPDDVESENLIVGIGEDGEFSPLSPDMNDNSRRFSGSGSGKNRFFRRRSDDKRFSGHEYSSFDSPEHVRGMFQELLYDDGGKNKEMIAASMAMDGDKLDSVFGIGKSFATADDAEESPGYLNANALKTSISSDKEKRESYMSEEVDSMFRNVSSPVPVSIDDNDDNDKIVNPDAEMSYAAFMERFSLKASKDLNEVTERFLWSIQGPGGNGEAPSIFQDMPPGFVFHGTKNMDERCAGFFDAMDTHFRAHPGWKHEPDEKFVSIRDSLERYCMLRIGDLAYAVAATGNVEEDDYVWKKTKCLQFITLEALDVHLPENLQDESVWALATKELHKVNEMKTPADKVACIVKCASIIFKILSHANNGDGSECGADEFIPLFIFVVLRAQVPKMLANCEFIDLFLNPTRLMGKAGYSLMNLRSALEFIKNLNAESITMEPEDFNRQFLQTQRQYDFSFE